MCRRSPTPDHRQAKKKPREAGRDEKNCAREASSCAATAARYGRFAQACHTLRASEHLARVLRQRILSILLMTLRRIAFKPIDKPGLGRAEEEPVMSGLLQSDEELLTAVSPFLVDLVAALEFGLERELAAQRMVSAAFAPDADVRVRR